MGHLNDWVYFRRLPSLRQKEDKRLLGVIAHNDEFQKFYAKQKKSFERLAKRVEELSKVKGCKDRIVGYVESKHRIRKLINQHEGSVNHNTTL